jgi:hypothetical protein
MLRSVLEYPSAGIAVSQRIEKPNNLKVVWERGK